MTTKSTDSAKLNAKAQRYVEEARVNYMAERAEQELNMSWSQVTKKRFKENSRGPSNAEEG